MYDYNQLQSKLTISMWQELNMEMSLCYIHIIVSWPKQCAIQNAYNMTLSTNTLLYYVVVVVVVVVNHCFTSLFGTNVFFK